jgi:signal transduction histidine kinase/ActR/RegA family two-component response regulator
MPPAADRDQIARARCDQVATLYRRGHLTSLSMGLGAAIFCAVMWTEAPHRWLGAWALPVAGNQAWRTLLMRAWQRRRPGPAAARRWGTYWAFGSTLAGSLWGLAAFVLFPASPAWQALVIVCLFGVVMGGLNLTSTWKPSFYGFVLPALVPLVVRVALESDAVHLGIAAVLAVVLVFVLGFGHRLNDVLTHSLAIRYENLDLITELKERTRAALSARAAAEAADRGKSQLLAAASHDLRQPLHALGLYAAALAARAAGTEWRPLVDSVQQGVAALESQFAQLLDLSRLEAGALAPEPVDMPLEPLVARVAAAFTPPATAHGLALRVVPTRLWVHSDPLLLERVLSNLVANAVRYTRRGGVVVGARRRGDRVAIVVADTGIGIAPEELSRIFEEFYQVARHDSGSRRGMGLGLAIVRRFAGLLGHRVDVRSRPGRGSSFTVEVPRARPVRMRRAAPSHVRAADEGAFWPAGAPAYGSRVPGHSIALDGALVAIVDDDPDAIAALRALLATRGADVAGGTSVESLLEDLGTRGRYPDLVVADLRLAHGTLGPEAIARLRDELGLAIPALLVSGDTSAEAQAIARRERLVLLGKPVDAVTLAGAMAALLEAAPPIAA